MHEYSKDGITIKSLLDTRRSNQDGKYSVRIRVIYRRIVKYFTTGVELTPAEWEGLKTSRKLASARDDIESSFELIKQTVRELAAEGEFSFENLYLRLGKASATTLNSYFDSKITQLKNEDRVGNMLFYRNVLSGIVRFSGNSVALEAVSVDWLRKYDKFLSGEGKNRTTVGMHMRAIRAILNEAKQQGNIKMSKYPFGRGRYEIQSGEGRKMALTLEQIGRIAKYESENAAPLKYRDYWLFLYLCNGINVADLVKLKYKDIVNGEICYVRQKTERTTKNRKEIKVVVTSPMQAIIDRLGNPVRVDNYIFPVLTGGESAMDVKRKTQYLTRAINKHMKAIGEELEIGSISTYTARHSFATVLKRSGANIAYISESLGHQDLKTTENYLASFERDERVKNANLLLGYEDNPKK